RLLFAQFQGASGMLHSITEAVFREWLQQVIECVGFKGLKRVAVIRSYKDGYRHCLLADLTDDLKSIQFGHLNIEEQQVRRPVLKCGEGRSAVAALAHYAEFRKGFQEFADAAPSQRFVIDNKCCVLHDYALVF